MLHSYTCSSYRLNGCNTCIAMAEPRVTDSGVPIDHLDYTYVRNCKNVKEVEKILRVLRSKSEGYYPDLIRFTEDRLYELCPQSKLLIKTSEAKRTSDLPFEESKQLNADLEQWTSEMSSKEVQHENGPTSKGYGPLGEASGEGGGMFEDEEEESDSTLPPVRTPGSITKTDAGASQNVSTGKSERIPSHDFRAWDKYNADREAESVDNEAKKSSSSVEVSPKGIPTELSETEKSMSSIEKEKAALREKNKGNEAYRAGDHHEALVYYTRSIKFCPSAAAYNNRAITGIKLGRNEEAINDCIEVLKLEPDNTKALFRRATAYSNIKEYRAAAEDLERALQLEPNNKKVQEELNRLRKNHLETVEQQEQPKKGRRIEIEESDGEEESSEGEKEPTNVEPEQETGGGQVAMDGQEQEGEAGGEKVMSDHQEVPPGTSSQDAESEACDGVAGYNSNGPIPSPGSENPETTAKVNPDTAKQQESPTLDSVQLQSTPIEEQEAPTTEIAKETVSQPESITQATSATLPDEAPPTEAVKGDIPQTQDVPQAVASETTMQSLQAQQEAPPPKVQEAPPPEPPPELPPAVKKLKEEGNDLFRRGQYGEAVNRYSKGIKLLEKASKAHIPNISTLLNNRAACHLKNGNIRGCIDDCTKSLELVPVNLKALLRRARAYEGMEKYKHAYNDFHLALRIDSSVEAAYTACARIARLLQDHDGHDWRKKLPPHPDAERVKAALAEHKYRSGSLGGVPSLSTVVNIDQSAIGDVSGSSSNHSMSESSVGATAAAATVGGTSSAESTDGGKRERRKEERKEQTDERVPEIPPVNVTATSNSTPQVTQTTQPVPSPHHADAPPTNPSLSQLAPEQKFEQLKAEGNEHVKKGEFVEALNCYSLCINACPNRVVAYTNRALCHLKLKSPRSAEEDCNMALTFEPQNVKALYRRALARKALCKYMEATKDLKTLLEVNPNNSVAQQEFEEVKQLWAKKLREIQLQKETAKAAPGAHKTKAGKVGGTSRKKSSGQRKSSMKEMKEAMRNNPIAELQKTKNELERLLKETTKLQEAARFSRDEPKKPANPTPSQTRKSELDKLIKESKAKTKANGEAKVSEGKATQAKAGETRAGGGTRGAGTRGAKGRAKGGSSNQSQTAAAATPSFMETLVGEEKMPGIFTKEKGDSEGHLTASKTTYYAQEKSKEEQGGVADGGSTTPPTTEVPLSEEVRPSSSSSSVGKEEEEEQGGESKRKKVVVEEGSESDEEEEVEKEVESETAPATAAQQDRADKDIDSSSTQQQMVTSQNVQDKPPATTSPSTKAKERLASPYEFVQRWNAIPRTAQSIEYARLLEQITPETLPEVITNKLDGMMLTNIIRAVDKQFVPKRQYKLSVDVLLYLTKVPRFEMNAMFLGPIEKEDLRNIFTVLSEHKDEISVPPAMLETMKRSYGVHS